MENIYFIQTYDKHRNRSRNIIMDNFEEDTGQQLKGTVWNSLIFGKSVSKKYKKIG